MKRMTWLAILLTSLWGGRALGAETLLLGINDGTAGQVDYAAMVDRYQPLADFLARTLKRPVKLETSQNLKSSTENLMKGRYALFFSKPSNVAARAMAQANYELVAVVQGAFTVNFIVRKDSGFKQPQDIRGRKIAYAEGTFMEKAGLATLRDLNLTPAPQQLVKARYQDAIAFIVENKFADVGMVSPVVAKQWEAKGGATLFQSKKLPFWCLIASPGKLSPQEMEQVRGALVALRPDGEGAALLKAMGVKGFEPGSKQAYLDMLKWLGA